MCLKSSESFLSHIHLILLSSTPLSKCISSSDSPIFSQKCYLFSIPQKAVLFWNPKKLIKDLDTQKLNLMTHAYAGELDGLLGMKWFSLNVETDWLLLLHLCLLLLMSKHHFVWLVISQKVIHAWLDTQRSYLLRCLFYH